MPPAVSVLFPFKDADRFITAALESLVSQTFDNFEVIMVDDGSSDNSRKIAEKFSRQDSRFRLFSGGNGLVSSLNYGLSVATGKWIARFDSDDICHPARLALQHALAEDHGEKTVVSCRVRSFPDSEVSSGYRSYENWINSLESFIQIEHNLFVESPIPHPTAFYSREAVIAAGGYANLGLPEDYELWLRLWSNGFRFVRVPRVLLAWRERSDRFSRTSSMYSLTSFYRTKARYLGHVPCLAGKRVYVAGSGQAARRLGKEIKRQGFHIEAFLSPAPVPVERWLCGRPVISIAEWDKSNGLPLVVASRKPGAAGSIQNFLQGEGLVNWVDFVLCS
ncbi:MAG: glycosyltransferase [Candidatus Fermentibacteria bacterium]|nr:glycosyltransferase [Candidatus Fermentibacteria bacterium]